MTGMRLCALRCELGSLIVSDGQVCFFITRTTFVLKKPIINDHCKIMLSLSNIEPIKGDLGKVLSRAAPKLISQQAKPHPLPITHQK
jgi:hypothetical protein